jgi:heterodisulfide reductase subunit A
MDIRAGGKKYDEFTRRAIEEEGAIYLRGRVSRLFEKELNGVRKIVVRGADTLSNRAVELVADMVVLGTAIQASPGSAALAQTLGTCADEYAFFSEAHPKLRPVESNTAGVFLAGACQAPKDIPEAVAQASAAASKVQMLFSRTELEREPYVAVVNPEKCFGCFNCEPVCPYKAITRKPITDRQGRVLRYVADVNKGLCQGCGGCVAICRANAVDLAGYSDEQIHAAISAFWPEEG